MTRNKISVHSWEKARMPQGGARQAAQTGLRPRGSTRGSTLPLPDPQLVLRRLAIKVNANEADQRWKKASAVVLGMLMNQPHAELIDSVVVLGVLSEQIVMRAVVWQHLSKSGFFELQQSAEWTDGQRLVLVQLLKQLIDIEQNIRSSCDRALLTPLSRVKIRMLAAASKSSQEEIAQSIVPRPRGRVGANGGGLFRTRARLARERQERKQRQREEDGNHG